MFFSAYARKWPSKSGLVQRVIHAKGAKNGTPPSTNDVVMKIDFETSYIFELLTVRDQESNKSQAFERLEALTAIEAAKVYKRVMRQIDDHNTKLILVSP